MLIDWKNSHCQKVCRLDAIFIKIPITFFTEIEQTVQFVWTQNSQSNNKKEKQS